MVNNTKSLVADKFFAAILSVAAYDYFEKRLVSVYFYDKFTFHYVW